MAQVLSPRLNSVLAATSRGYLEGLAVACVAGLLVIKTQTVPEAAPRLPFF